MGALLCSDVELFDDFPLFHPRIRPSDRELFLSCCFLIRRSLIIQPVRFQLPCIVCKSWILGLKLGLGLLRLDLAIFLFVYSQGNENGVFNLSHVLTLHPTDQFRSLSRCVPDRG